MIAEFSRGMGVGTTQGSDGAHKKSIGCWRPLAGASSMTSGPANVVLEPNVKLKPEHIESLGADFEKSAKGFIDFCCWVTTASR
jgi:hypothetical protein